jgi:signal transduction histidine kinase
MDQLIGQLLTYARLGRGEHRKVVIDLSALVADALTLVTVPDAFVVDIDIEVAPFIGAAVPLSAVVRNLVANAVLHHDRADGHISIRARATGDTCRIEVADDGPGIPAAAQARIFRLFQTARTAGAGSGGIGLAVCRRLCETYGGSIDVTSEPGGGASFVVEWPLTQRADRG